MKLDDVRKLSPPDRLVYWVRERQQIFVKRRAGLPAPWTDDPILQSYRFCNVRRMDDVVSDWLLQNWYRPITNRPAQVVTVVVVLARHFNNVPTLSQLSFPPGKRWLDDCKQVLLARRDRGEKTFNSAYVISGGTGGPKGSKYDGKIEMVMDCVIRPMSADPPTIYTDSMQRTHEQLCNYRGIASFMAGQIVADLRWTIPGAWRDKDTWAPFGPGSQQGMCRYYGLAPSKTRFKQEEFLKNLREIRKYVESKVRIPGLEMMDYQSTLCELSKYEKALWGEEGDTKARPKQLYDGGG